MPETITMNDFLSNPTGKSSSSFARRDLVIADLGRRFNELSSKYLITTNMYICKDKTYAHIRIPSEVFGDKLWYDVVLEFTKDEESDDKMTINHQAMRMFSNSMNFNYTYAYVYNLDDNLVPFLKSKLLRQSLTSAPSIRNPQMTYGFEKTVYFALLHIKHAKLNYIKNIKSHAVNITNTSLLERRIRNNVTDSKVIIDIYNELKKLAVLEKKAKRENAKAMAKARTTKTMKESSRNLGERTTRDLRNKKNSSFNVVKPRKAKKTLDTHKRSNK